MKKVIAFGLVVFAFAGTVYAGDKAAGEAKYAVCASCHGKAGKSTNPIYPKLNGQHAAYVITALQAYKANERSSANAAQMMPFAAMLSEDDMKNIAAYLASQ